MRGRNRSVTVAYLGPDGSYSSLAAHRRFGTDVGYRPQRTIGDVFLVVHRKECDYGVVPVENSTDGRIIDTMVAITRYRTTVCAEIGLRVRHALMAAGPMETVREIHSKPQAISQCREWLATHCADIPLYPAESTTAAVLLAEEQPGVAAIAPEGAAGLRGLNVLAREIQDDPENQTRFLVLGEERPAPSGDDRTLVLLKLPHRCGSLADALGILRAFQINLSRIESFPVRGSPEHYWFCIEFDGHRDQPHCHSVLESLKLFATEMFLAGSFPVNREDVENPVPESTMNG
ncbi:MAG: prephenate dehydratase domain-containing protein [Planctomycetia bacterium]|nr:prephenate dehydratase domain-containing protein [Planctomycetia bacterium]